MFDNPLNQPEDHGQVPLSRRFRRRLTRARGNRSLADVAERSGLSVNDLKQLEAGANPSFLALQRWAHAIGLRFSFRLEHLGGKLRGVRGRRDTADEIAREIARDQTSES